MAVNGIIGIKLGMTRVFADDGAAVPCTVLQAGPCVVVQRRSKQTDGYDAVQLGFVEFVKPQRISKPMTGHFKKANVAPMRMLREIRVDESNDDSKVGDRVLVDRFAPGELVDVTGVSKGNGCQGGVKRWHYRGGDATHGSMFHRAPGGIGARWNMRSEEHTSELQSQSNLVCRLLLEKKKKTIQNAKPRRSSP